MVVLPSKLNWSKDDKKLTADYFTALVSEFAIETGLSSNGISEIIFETRDTLLPSRVELSSANPNMYTVIIKEDLFPLTANNHKHFMEILEDSRMCENLSYAKNIFFHELAHVQDNMLRANLITHLPEKTDDYSLKAQFALRIWSEFFATKVAQLYGNRQERLDARFSELTVALLNGKSTGLTSDYMENYVVTTGYIVGDINDLEELEQRIGSLSVDPADENYVKRSLVDSFFALNTLWNDNSRWNSPELLTNIVQIFDYIISQIPVTRSNP